MRAAAPKARAICEPAAGRCSVLNVVCRVVRERNKLRLAAMLFVVAGAYVWAIALRLVPFDESKIHAPDWVVFLCGSLFVLAGLALLFRSNRLVVALLGNLIVLVFGTVAAWVSLFGPSDHFSGSIPLISEAANVRFARIVFGFCTVLCALMLIPGIRELRKLMRKTPASGKT